MKVTRGTTRIVEVQIERYELQAFAANWSLSWVRDSKRVVMWFNQETRALVAIDTGALPKDSAEIAALVRDAERYAFHNVKPSWYASLDPSRVIYPKCARCASPLLESNGHCAECGHRNTDTDTAPATFDFGTNGGAY